MGPLGPLLGISWAVLRRPGVLRRVRGWGLGSLLRGFEDKVTESRYLDTTLGRLGAVWLSLDPSWPPWAVLGASWNSLGASSGPLGASWAFLGVILKPSWAS